MVLAYAVLVCELLRWHSIAAAKTCVSNTPVCASDGNTYNTICHLNQAKRKDRNLQMIHSGPCRLHIKQNLLSLDYYFSYRSEIPESKLNFASSPEGLQIQPKACPLVYTPVCGTNEKTYGSKCALSAYAVFDPTLKVKHMGECHTAERTRHRLSKLFKHKPNLLGGSINHCPPVWDPVCGTDEKTYENKCALQYKALLETTLMLQYEGECTNEKALLEVYQRPKRKTKKKRQKIKGKNPPKFNSYEIHV